MGFNKEFIKKAVESLRNSLNPIPVNRPQDPVAAKAAEMLGAKTTAEAKKKTVNDAVSKLNFRRLDEEDVRKMGLKKGGSVMNDTAGIKEFVEKIPGVIESKMGLKKGGKVKAKASSASKRADGIAMKGKTKGRMM